MTNLQGGSRTILGSWISALPRTAAWQQRALGHLTFCKIGMVLHLLESSRARRATDRVESGVLQRRAPAAV